MQQKHRSNAIIHRSCSKDKVGRERNVLLFASWMDEGGETYRDVLVLQATIYLVGGGKGAATDCSENHMRVMSRE